MYMNHGPSGQSQPSSSPMTHPQSSSSNGQYPFAFDTSYQAGGGAGPSGPSGPSGSTSSSSYEYSYARTPSGPINNNNHDVVQPSFQPPQAGSSVDAWYGGDTSNERGTTRGSTSTWPATQTQSQLQSYDTPGTSSSSYHPYATGGEPPLNSGWDHGKGVTNSQWPDEYAEPSSTERELVGLRMTLSDLVESIRPYASSPSNPRPPPPSSYLQARFVRLASTVQTTLSNLQPNLHQTLHPQFNLPPPRSSQRRQRSKSKFGVGGSSPPGAGGGMSSAEKEMEVIRKRRDMLIARAAQVQASSHPAAVHPSQLPANWPANHGELYQNGAGVYSNNNNTYPISNDHASASLNSSRRSTITLENFDASLARFSLDPTKIGQNNPSHSGNGNGNGLLAGFVMEEKKQSAEDGRCHGCGVSVTAEWRRGPDGPRSLCNACGLHYAKLTRRRAQEEANANVDTSTAPDFNSFPPSMHTFPVEGIM